MASGIFKVIVPCDLHEVRAAIANVHDFLAKNGWSADDLMSFDLVLVEACNNAIQHARGRTEPVTLETICDSSGVEFRIHDHTPGFDWPQSAQLPPENQEHGRGLYLIRTLMDHAGYLRGEDENILVLRKTKIQPRSRIKN